MLLPRSMMFSPEALPLKLKFLMLPVATPSARTDPATESIGIPWGVSTTARGNASPHRSLYPSFALARRGVSAFARPTPLESMPARCHHIRVPLEHNPAVL